MRILESHSYIIPVTPATPPDLELCLSEDTISRELPNEQVAIIGLCVLKSQVISI